jgi:hypothetical protein
MIFRFSVIGSPLFDELRTSNTIIPALEQSDSGGFHPPAAIKETGGRRFRLARWSAIPELPLFQVPEPSVQNLLDASQLGAPEVAHIVKSLVYSIEARIEALIHSLKFLVSRLKPPVYGVEFRPHPQNHQADNRAVECHRRNDRDDLLVCHCFAFAR